MQYLNTSVYTLKNVIRRAAERNNILNLVPGTCTFHNCVTRPSQASTMHYPGAFGYFIKYPALVLHYSEEEGAAAFFCTAIKYTSAFFLGVKDS